MNIRLVVTGFTLVLAGCAAGTSDTSDLLRAATPDAATQSASALASAAPVAKRSTPTFASMPDRGDLLGYLPAPPRDVGRTSWHRVEVSEAHALRAAVSGSLRMTAPDGQVLDFRHTRHVEYPDGNWSWVGELPNVPGSQAIITFGERAVFGTFRRPGARPLELTMREGVAWVVERDPAAMRGVDPSGDPDFLVAPSAIRRAASTVRPVASGEISRTTSAATTGTAGPVVDLVLGYTSGYASFHGGQSQANTRLTHLVTITNDAYTRSRLDAQVRLVRTVQVTYPDNTDNSAALTDLTGSNGKSTTTIPASLMPLRQARDQYGGDLVSLVRKFNEPENAGCGLAWLIGGGGSTYTTSDAPWGYSIVSDGSDGQSYCREETLAHELGHNMGQNHNAEDSHDSNDAPMTGAHPYSYGYRESSSTGFFTIMAYRSADSQYSIPYFANPNVLVDGRPTGVANASDNVRSMVQTIPVAAAFRAQVYIQPNPHNDVDGDAKSDIILYRPGSLAYWIMSGTAIARSKSFTVANDWRVLGTGDFDRNGRVDLVMMNSNREVYAWLGNGTSFAAYRLAQLASGYRVVGTGDVDRDGKDDILLYRTGQLVHWVMDGGRIVRSSSHSVAAGLNAMAVGDFDADERADVALVNTSGDLYVLHGIDSGYVQFFIARISTSLSINAAQDIDGDGKDDLLLFRPGQIVQFFMDGTRVSRSRSLSLSTSYSIATTGDFNGDLRGDVVLQHNYNRSLYVWLGAGTGYSSSSLVTPASGYALVR